jgi:predicted outer membrane repeat protein
LESVTFSDFASTYKNNSALYGGAISCTKCTIYTQECSFQYNSAYEGGVINAESDSNITSLVDKFQKNKATSYGGVISVTTRSYFKFSSSKFLYNQAKTDSTISALKTSY